jgi:hypothetical protein
MITDPSWDTLVLLVYLPIYAILVLPQWNLSWLAFGVNTSHGVGMILFLTWYILRVATLRALFEFAP